MKPKISYPLIGKMNSEVIKGFLENLDLEVISPPPITDKTIKLGVKYSPDMMCFPYKVTLGTCIESLEKGANTLLMYDSKGECRLKQYYKLYEYTLKDLGFDFQIIPCTITGVIPQLKKLSGKSLIKVTKEFLNAYSKIKTLDEDCQQWSDEKPNIGIIGEIYCACDEKVNHSLEEKIKKYGGNPYNTSRIGNFVKDSIKKKLKIYDMNLFNKNLRSLKKQAQNYFNGKLGGHSFENIYNLLDLVNKKVDGVIHILPLSCMPESTIEPYINGICNKSRTPLLRLHIDENNSEANLETRLETFVELIKWKK